LPVLTSVRMEVRARSESDVRKKRSAGGAETFGVVTELAILKFPS